MARSSRIDPAIAIDGPVASGKSSVGSRVAAALGWPFVDTGTMYRALTWQALRSGIDTTDPEALARLAGAVELRVLPPPTGSSEYATVLVDGQDATQYLRTTAVEAAVSAVAAVPGVRRRMVSLQRGLAEHHPVVMAGRDIGTVVLPEASLKVYLDASVAMRAQRRLEEIMRRGAPAELDAVLADTLRRDALDSARADSPLKPAQDALLLNTDALTQDEVVERVLELARPIVSSRR